MAVFNAVGKFINASVASASSVLPKCDFLVVPGFTYGLLRAKHFNQLIIGKNWFYFS